MKLSEQMQLNRQMRTENNYAKLERVYQYAREVLVEKINYGAYGSISFTYDLLGTNLTQYSFTQDSILIHEEIEWWSRQGLCFTLLMPHGANFVEFCVKEV